MTTDLLKTGSDWLGAQRKAHASSEVRYVRGADPVDVQATVGRTVFEVDTGDGVVERWEARDYLIVAADLILGGEIVTPEVGDQIRETQGDKVYVYEVLAPGAEPCWRYSDPWRATLRVHTKLVDTEVA
ncbi:MAG TPA: hypothetical protein VM243_00785 [Phycisphaerae bacterium]|nr:hypothetical protein [Phycisphaerae bacterium]